MRLRTISFWTIFVAAIAIVGGWSFWLRPRSDALPAKSPPALASPTAAAIDFSIVKSYPHDANAFTQGLLWHDGRLIEGTGLIGRSELRRVDLPTGRVLQRQKLPADVFGEGVALVDNRLIQISWKNQRAFVYAEKSFSKLGEWKYEGEGWGLTFDGKSLIMSDGSDTLTFRDPKTFAAKSTLAVTFNGKPLSAINELEWIEGEIWANVWQTNYIVRIDPQSGVVKSYLDCSQLLNNFQGTGREDVLNGIAYDAQTKRIFVTGKLWPRLFEIKLKAP